MDNKLFVCEVCNRVFFRERDMIKYVIIYEKDIYFKCFECDEIF